MGLFGGDSSSSSSTKNVKTTRIKTDSSVNDFNVDAGGLLVTKASRGRQVVNVSGLQSGDVSALVSGLSGGFAGVAAAGAASGETVADIARAATGTQSELGKLAGSLALPVAAVVGLFLWLRSK